MKTDNFISGDNKFLKWKESRSQGVNLNHKEVMLILSENMDAKSKREEVEDYKKRSLQTSS